MKKLFFISLFTAVCSCLGAQDIFIPAGDTLSVPEAPKASSLFEELDVEQSTSLRDAFDGYVLQNSARKVTCYRVRIYFDSSQKARDISASIEARFSEMYPQVPVYRIYTSPFFKVTVGDFRTRDEAHRFANSIAGQFPSSFLVKEASRFPSLWSNKD